MNVPPEVCLCAAVLVTDPGGTQHIIRGHRHSHALETAGEMGFEMREAVQGFLTSRGRFVGRTEAMDLQKAAGVPLAYSPDGVLHGKILFSEDLY